MYEFIFLEKLLGYIFTVVDIFYMTQFIFDSLIPSERHNRELKVTNNC